MCGNFGAERGSRGRRGLLGWVHVLWSLSPLCHLPLAERMLQPWRGVRMGRNGGVLASGRVGPDDP